MFKKPARPANFVGPLFIALTAVVLFLLEPASGQLLAYDRYAIQGTETWRMLSGNLVHTNGVHLLLNVAGLALLWALHGEHYYLPTFLRVFLWTCVGCSVGIYFFSENLIWYAGLSGALHGVFVWGAFKDIEKNVLSGWVLLAGVALKIIYEQTTGANAELEQWIDAAVAIDAHLYGAVSGAILFIIMRLISTFGARWTLLTQK
ncbi:rhombosortase [Alteromonas sp. ASW11-130]|uniref:rhombosortase n=1 Tax=Alteromonas sp. ASW11-130 TaxID=3015775 RepID=UPI0022419921|nr:rhombosortase [Alteromonas sp. ASW11-130]MCW8092456.1 rhombosortase [Alteromonas sp. ASW11-130]